MRGSGAFGFFGFVSGGGSSKRGRRKDGVKVRQIIGVVIQQILKNRTSKRRKSRKTRSEIRYRLESFVESGDGGCDSCFSPIAVSAQFSLKGSLSAVSRSSFQQCRQEDNFFLALWHSSIGFTKMKRAAMMRGKDGRCRRGSGGGR